MKRALISVALLAGLITPAAAAPPTWQGDMFITTISETSAGVSCKAVNAAVGDFHRTVLRPKGLTGESGPTDLIAFHSNRSAVQLAPTSPTTTTLNGATAATTRTIFGSSGFVQIAGVTITASLSPYPVAIGTPSVTVSMTINNVYSKNAATPSGCNITINGVLGKRLS
jgi:hypothetical protein